MTNYGWALETREMLEDLGELRLYVFNPQKRGLLPLLPRLPDPTVVLPSLSHLSGLTRLPVVAQLPPASGSI